jgi:hypothetical protein
MLTKVKAYKCPNGVLETDPLRAFAWKLSSLSPQEKVTFTAAIWILENRAVVKEVIDALESEME